MRLLLHERCYDRIAPALQEASPGLQCLLVNDAGGISLDGVALSVDDAQPEVGFAGLETLFSAAARPFFRAVLKSSVLKWVQSGAAGVDSLGFGRIVEKGARLTTSHGQASGVADYVMWGVMDALQDGPARRNLQSAARWEARPFREVAGTRWTIVGFGAIGRGVAVRARAFGAHVTAVRRRPDPDPAADRVSSLEGFPALLPETDVLVLAAPLTAETRRLVDASAISRMTPGSVLVNVARGGLVEEQALLAGLDQGAPGHAVLDVFDCEPLPSDSAFWAHPRVTLTAHAAGMSASTAQRNDAAFIGNLRRYLAGEPLLHEASGGKAPAR